MAKKKAVAAPEMEATPQVEMQAPPVKAAPIKQPAAPKTPEWEIKDRVYYLISRKRPIIVTVPSKHSSKRSLLWFDKELGYQRELRYASNQPSPFVDEQEGAVTLAHIIFRDGTLTVPAQQIALQKLLSLYHPLKGSLYEEFNPEQNAEVEVDNIELDLDEKNTAHEMDIDEIEAIMRVEVGSKVREMSSRELKRDVLIFARNNPKTFLSLASDENVYIRSMGILAVEQGLMELGDDQRTFMWKSTGRKVMTVPFGEQPYSALAAYFKTDEGVEVYQSIEKRLK